MKILGREPAVVIGAIVAVVSALSAAVTAAMTRPVAPSAFTGVVTAGVALLAAYHFNVAPATVGSLNALVLAVLVFLTRGQVSPATARPTPLSDV